MLSELFTPVETPEAPNRGFFKGLFGGGAQSLDREDLCEYTYPELIVTSSLFILRRLSVGNCKHIKFISISELRQLVKQLRVRPPVAWPSTFQAQGVWRE